MTGVRVGDVRLNESGALYVITHVGGGLACGVLKNGIVFPFDNIETFENDKLLKHYDTLAEAFKSDEFNKE